MACYSKLNFLTKRIGWKNERWRRQEYISSSTKQPQYDGVVSHPINSHQFPVYWCWQFAGTQDSTM